MRQFLRINQSNQFFPLNPKNIRWALWILVLLNAPLIRADEMKTTTDTSQNIKVRNLLRFKLSGTYGADETVMYSDPSASDKYDNDFDALKMISPAVGVPNIYFRIEDLNMSINVIGNISASKEIPLEVSIKSKGNYKMELTEMLNFFPTASAILEDRLTGSFYNLSKTRFFEFFFQVGIVRNRFFVHLNSPVSVNAISESCQQNDGKIGINNSSQMAWNIVITDKSKKVVFERKEFKGYESISNLPEGDYTVSLDNRYGESYAILCRVAGMPDLSGGFSLSGGNIVPGNSVVFSSLINEPGTNYSWKINDILISEGMPEFVHEFHNPGDYKVSLEVTNQICRNYFERTIHVENPNYSSNPEKEEFVIQASMHTGMLRIFFKQKDFIPDQIKITDITGKLIGEEQILPPLSSENNPLEISVNSLKPGLYFLTLWNKNRYLSRPVFLSEN